MDPLDRRSVGHRDVGVVSSPVTWMVLAWFSEGVDFRERHRLLRVWSVFVTLPHSFGGGVGVEIVRIAFEWLRRLQQTESNRSYRLAVGFNRLTGSNAIIFQAADVEIHSH